MGEIIEIDTSGRDFTKELLEKSFVKLSEELLLDARINLSEKKSISMPIAKLSSLGAGVSSLLPAMRTVTQTIELNTSGLYRLANASIGDTLKAAKNGNFWGAIKTASGKSKMGQFQSVSSVFGTSSTVPPLDPASIMMAVALFSVENKIEDIIKVQQEIISFLEIEKESEIEADVETLSNIITKYKLNWDNERFVASNHKMVLDIQRTARKNMNGYQKKVSDIIDSKSFFVMQNQVASTQNNLLKKFEYYRLSLYIFALSSLLEIMLSGNFKEEYICSIKNEIETLTENYRVLFEKSSVYLEKLSSGSIETNLLKSVGFASKAVGKFIGEIPFIKEGPVDEFLQDSGEYIESNAKAIESSATVSFKDMCNPETTVIVDKMEDMIQIYNHTEDICFDSDNIYLIVG